MTQEELAERSGVSADVIRRLEQGRRSGAQLRTLGALARALDVRTSDLLSPDTELDHFDNGDTASLLDIRRILFPAFGADGIPDGAPSTAEGLAAQIDRVQVEHSRGLYQANLSDLTDLIPAVERHVRENPSPEAATLAARAYKILAEVLIQMRHDDLAQDVVKRSMAYAENASDPVLYALCAENAAWIMILHARFADAVATSLHLARLIEPPISSTDRQRLDAYGRMCVRASAAASRNADAGATAEAESLARAAAHRLGGGMVYQMRFGPAKLAIAESENAIVMGDPETALRIGQAVQLRGTPGKRHLLTMAEAQIATRDYAGALATLNGARTLAPEWLKHQRLGRRMVRDLLDVVPIRAARENGLADLAVDMGLRP
ncbi:hypothetical protein ACG83_34885 [Frankia sp. R43]|nr:hypothetical protein ACG83_34885 [Frankia sp. R43]